MKKSISVLVMAAVMAGSTTFMPMHTAEAGQLEDTIAKGIGVLVGGIFNQGGKKSSGSNSSDGGFFNKVGNQKHAVQNPNDNEQLFLMAVNDGDIELAREILKTGIDINGVYKIDRGLCSSYEGNTPLSIAIWRGNRKMQQFLLENGADVSGYYTFDNKYCSYIVKAMYEKKLELVQYLHNWGASINSYSDLYERSVVTAFISHIGYAGDGFYIPACEWLINNGANIEEKSKKTGNTIYLDAVNECCYNLIDYMAANGANINARNDAGKNALQIAIAKKDVQLYKHIQDVNARGQQPSKKKQ